MNLVPRRSLLHRQQFNDLLEEWIDAVLEGGFAGYILQRRELHRNGR